MLGNPAKRLSWPFRQPDQGGGARQGTGKKTTGKKTPLCSLRVQAWEEGAREMAASRSSRLLTLALSQGLWALMSPSLTSCSPLQSSRGKEPGARGWGSWFPATQLTWPRVGMMSPGEDFLEEEVD